MTRPTEWPPASVWAAAPVDVILPSMEDEPADAPLPSIGAVLRRGPKGFVLYAIVIGFGVLTAWCGTASS